MTPEHRAAVAGVTDSEHVFRYLMSAHEREPSRPVIKCLRTVALQIIAWCREIDPTARIGLNLMLTDGTEIVGTRFGRTLFYIERDGVYDCEICGFPHIHHDPRRSYRATVVASEPITHETWHEMPDGSIYRIDPEVGLHIESLRQESAAASAAG